MADPKGTIAIDSVSELARLFFSKDMGKKASDMDKIRAMNNYPGTTERLQMFVRRCKDLRNLGWEVVFLAHEDIQKVYGRGGAMASKGQTPAEPVAVKGWPDMPGQRTPDDFCRVVDNVIRMRWQQGKAVWIGRKEALSAGAEYWEVKDRFNAPAVNTGLLPASYLELANLAKVNPLCNWSPSYIWMLYGSFGIGKTRSLLTFPRPLVVYDLDGGSKSIEKEANAEGSRITIHKDFNPEEGSDADRFLAHFATQFK